MTLALYLTAAAILAILFWDAFITVFSARGAGPLTRLWTQTLWQGLLRVHQRQPIHLLLALTGPLMLLGVVCCWYLLLTIGWTCFFLADSGSLVDEQGLTQASFLPTLYFAGSTVSGVGYGDIVPAEVPWTLWSNVATFSGTVLLTASISYLLPIVSASIQRKTLAQRIFSVGATAAEFVRTAWGGEDRGALNEFFLETLSRIDLHAHQHLAYPILYYFHSSDPRRSPSRAVLLFADALFLTSKGVAPDARPPSAIFKLAEASLDNYIELAKSGANLKGPTPNAENPELSLETIRSAGLPATTPGEFDAALAEYLAWRGQLVAICRGDGWTGE